MTRFIVAAALAAVLAGCSSSQKSEEAENPVDVCADKGIGPAHAQYEKCLEDTARGRCSQVGTAESAEYGACMKNQSDQASPATRSDAGDSRLRARLWRNTAQKGLEQKPSHKGVKA